LENQWVKHVSLQNHVIAGLPPFEVQRVLDFSRAAILPAGYVLYQDRGDPPATVYFPQSGVISIRSSLPSGSHVEVAAVGCDGAFGLVGLLEVPLPSIVAQVTIDMVATTIPFEAFRTLLPRTPALKAQAFRCIGRLFADSVRSAACYRFHSHQQWLARWLLTTADASRHDVVPVTHDAIAGAIGSPRHAVSASLAQLRAEGVLAAERGVVSILDRDGLAAVACDCYTAPAESEILRC
jgi:CRP-like cAMP-binding protein